MPPPPPVGRSVGSLTRHHLRHSLVPFGGIYPHPHRGTSLTYLKGHRSLTKTLQLGRTSGPVRSTKG